MIVNYEDGASGERVYLDDKGNRLNLTQARRHAWEHEQHINLAGHLVTTVGEVLEPLIDGAMRAEVSPVSSLLDPEDLPIFRAAWLRYMRSRLGPLGRREVASEMRVRVLEPCHIGACNYANHIALTAKMALEKMP